MPLISVILPSYNYARFLPEATDSVLGQSFSDFEFLITDDGSTDDSFAIAQSYPRKDARIFLTRQQNRGLISTLNSLFARARGSWIAQINADEVWLPNRLAHGIETVSVDGSLIAAFSSYYYVSHDLSPLPLIHHWAYGERVGSTLIEHLMVQNFVCTVTALLTREAILRLGTFARNLPCIEDWDLWLRLARLGPMILTKLATALFRLHGQKLTTLREHTLLQNERRVLEEHSGPLAAIYGFRNIWPQIWTRLAGLSCRIGERGTASLYLTKLAEVADLSAMQKVQRTLGLCELGEWQQARAAIGSVTTEDLQSKDGSPRLIAKLRQFLLRSNDMLHEPSTITLIKPASV